MTERKIIPEGPISDSVNLVLKQIAKERQLYGKSNHIFEVDSFWWKFDIATLRQNIVR